MAQRYKVIIAGYNPDVPEEWQVGFPDDDSFADKGYMLGVKIDRKKGVVNCAMTGIMSMIAKTKKELKEASKRNNKSELQRLKMMYQRRRYPWDSSSTWCLR
jgi:hypothetical protein